MAERRIALLLGSLSGGGAERIVLELAGALAKREFAVDLVVCRLEGALVPEIPGGVRPIELGTAPRSAFLRTLLRLPAGTWLTLLPVMLRKPLKKIRALPFLELYLRREQPDVILASTHVPNLLAVWAVRLSGLPIRTVLKQDNSLARSLADSTDPLRRKLLRLVRLWYRRADAVVAVSKGVGDELVTLGEVPREKVQVIHNPIDTGRITRQAEAQPDHPWFQPGQPPVLLAAGRLHPQKDYPTLLRAFAALRKARHLRLAILGEGRERPHLEKLTQDLGIGADVRLLGFQPNPFAFMARAAVFVLSSAWEGLGNVLIEALACGCPVVSTDCPHGPSEILARGRYGALVPVGDPERLARAIGETLERPGDPRTGLQRARAFDIQNIAEQYEQLLCRGSDEGRRRCAP
ncbi:MAG TPA: glycosyltransferase [Desulfobacterales bacterium]|jgi:glycosyltransferase involved in cell wall biosynthesis|nr:glycosyltransferase [Desulfobacterales bacterium]